MKAKTFGLDIGTTSIKVMSLRRDGIAYSLEAAAVAPSTMKGILSESIIDQQFLADTIKNMLNNAQIKTREVNVSIPESQVYTKILEMPQLSEQELGAALKWEMEQYIPLPLDQVRTDWQILERCEKDGRKTMNVLIIAAPNVVLSKYEKIMTMSGLLPQTIETEMISVQRAIFPLIHSPNPSIVVHLGASTTDVSVVKNGIANMVFYISLGGIAITRAVSVDLGIDINQAEDLKRAYGLNQEVFEGKIGKSLHPILESIVGDIKKAILLYKEKNDNEEIRQIILSGGSALLPGINTFFTNSLGIQVVLGNCWSAYNIGNVPNELLVDAPSYNVVVGLSLRDVV